MYKGLYRSVVFGLSALLLVAGLAASGCSKKEQVQPEPVVPSAQVELAVPDAERVVSEDDALSQDADPGHEIGSQIVKPELTAPDAQIETSCLLYWVTSSGEIESVESTIPDSQHAPQAALDRLCAGVTDKERKNGLHSTLPAGVKLNSVEMDDTVCVVDLSPEFAQDAPEAELRCRVAQIVLTACQFNEVEAVLIRVNGSTPNLGNNINLLNPQMPDLWR